MVVIGEGNGDVELNRYGKLDARARLHRALDRGGSSHSSGASWRFNDNATTTMAPRPAVPALLPQRSSKFPCIGSFELT